jgi:AAA+ ATPase superfamily predicted ATPase
MKSPFQYGKLAEGLAFVNRTKEKQMLKNNLVSGINTMLISPRRLGKSSLVKSAMVELQNENKNIKVCYIDAFTILSEEEFYQAFARETVKSTGNAWKSWISTAKEYLKALSPRISIGSDPVYDFSIGFELRAIKDNELDLLNLPERIAQSKNIRLIVCIDEFQQLAKLKNYEAMEQKMRSVWQHQQNVSYCLYGSKRHMMIDIFNSSSKPFYRFGQIMFLSKIAASEWVDFIVRSFGETGKKISATLAAQLAGMVELHSWYVQQLAHFVWNLTDDEVSANILQEAFEQVIDTNMPLYQNECESLTASQINLLIAIANKERSLTAVSVMAKYKLGTPQNVSKNKKMLQNADLTDKTKEGFVFLDPVFNYWFAREYAN